MSRICINTFIKMHCKLNGPAQFFNKLHLTPMGHLVVQVYSYENLKESYKKVTQDMAHQLYNKDRLIQFCCFFEELVKNEPDMTAQDDVDIKLVMDNFPGTQFLPEKLVYSPSRPLYNSVYEYIEDRYGYNVEKVFQDFEIVCAIIDEVDQHQSANAQEQTSQVDVS